jgi:PhzF family phenazine biosynthesis protein
MSRPFAQVDVFSSQPLGGNPVAVVLDGEGLADERMQALARWTNLSETTFVLPPSSDAADYRVRIFTPVLELPFAGHPTLGTCHAWLAHRGGGADEVVQECAVGLVRIRRVDGRLAFAEPPLVRQGPLEEELVARACEQLGLERDEVVDAAWVDNGPGWSALLLADPERLLALDGAALDADVGLVAPLPDGGFEVRAFFPKDGVGTEDPVTGSLNASLARWLVDTGRATVPYVARQGTALGRAGRVHVSADADGVLWIAGETVTYVTGELQL